MSSQTVVIILLLVAVGVLGYFAVNQQRQIKDLNAKARSFNLELQEKCAKQAAWAFEDWGWKKKAQSFYANHYNESLNRCFIVIESTDATNPNMIWTNKGLYDAFEGKAYGDYIWHSDEKKKYWEMPPTTCEVTGGSGEKKLCHSSEEFDELIKPYVQ
jgi:hypothetical protein